MFGVLKPICSWSCHEKSEWMGHLCGTCLALRDHCGQTARLTTNYDAALISVLCEAQAAAPLPTVTHVCPLRGLRRAEVIAPSASASRYAASLSTLMAATKIDDHAADGDGWVARLPTLFKALGRRWRKAARPLGFDTGNIERHTAEQDARESGHRSWQ